MEFKQIHELKHFLHEHPLILEDLQSMYQDYEEDDDECEDEDLIAMQNFTRICGMCGLGIDWYHRYHYKCDTCHYSLHKFCAEVSTSLRFPAHPLHTLILKEGSNSWSCHACFIEHEHGICYHCSTCNYEIDLSCVTFVDQTTIHHPGHPHALISATVNPTLSKCDACGKKHEGVFYHCITCFNFSIHVDCVTLPFKFFLQNIHTHMITLSYSFSAIPDHSKCRICRLNISEELWLYKCSKCRYYVHLDCATSRGEPFMTVFSHGIGKANINYEVADYPDLLNYPLLDESYSILSNHVLRGKEFLSIDQIKYDSRFLIHFNHDYKHQLLLINTTGILHDPIMRIKILCNGCVGPITTTPFYVCKQVVDGCDFYLHEWCTRLPTEIENHPGHPQHPLTLFHTQPTDLFFAGFECGICRLHSNGFGYGCSTCNYQVDVNCGFIPKTITHEAHPNHLLSLVYPPSSQSTSTTLLNACHACDIIIKSDELCFGCRSCDFYLDNRCALHLPKTIKNKYDKHPLKLSYYPIENHKSQYFCEVCEEELNPEKWFYHCLECGQSIHSACAPLILRSEQDVNSLHVEGVYMFLNMKFGGLFIFGPSKHSLLFLAGVKSDDHCSICEGELQSSPIFNCLTCKQCCHASCVMAVVTQVTQWHNDFLVLEAMEDLRKRREPKKILKPQIARAALTYYPKGVMRPVTGHRKAVDGVIKQS